MAAKAKSLPITSQRELDPERTLEADPRDPRMSRSQWPCRGAHVQGKPQSNKWAQWITCERCALRLQYTPKQGSPATNVSHPNPKMVEHALRDLRELLPEDMEPNESLFKAAFEKVVAEERLKTLLQDYKAQLSKLQKKVTKGRQAMTSGRTGAEPSDMGGYPMGAPHTPRSTTASWARITPPHSPDMQEMYDMMTEEEKKELMERLRQRRVAIPVSDTELEPNYDQ